MLAVADYMAGGEADHDDLTSSLSMPSLIYRRGQPDPQPHSQQQQARSAIIRKSRPPPPPLPPQDAAYGSYTTAEIREHLEAGNGSDEDSVSSK